MQLRSGRNASREFRLDVHVDVLQFRLPFELSGFNFSFNLLESSDNRLQFRPTQEPDALKHVGMNLRPLDVLSPQPPIERNGFGEPRGFCRRAAGKSAAARYGRRLLHANRLRNVRRTGCNVTPELARKASRWLASAHSERKSQVLRCHG